MKNKIKLIYVPILYAFVLLLVAVLPINGKQAAINHVFIFDVRLDYILHSLLFVPWMVSVFFISKSNAYNVEIIDIVIWLLVGVWLTVFTEGVQLFISYRTFNYKDLISNFIGLFTGLIFYLIILYMSRRHIQKG